MNTQSRIASILNTSILDESVVGVKTFDLSSLILDWDLDFALPNNLRLGHMAEKIVGELIKQSTNYVVLYENIQIIENKATIGEIDFIIKHLTSNELIHLELAYKFYLFDPNKSINPIHNWIGPNRNDSLAEKLEKLFQKQFPLLYHEATKSSLNTIKIDKVSQALCLLVSLFIPYESDIEFDSVFRKAIKGYYLNYDTFVKLDHFEKTYFVPSKKEWGIDPSNHKIWKDVKAINQEVYDWIDNKQAPLCWLKHGNKYETFFITWW